MWPGPVSMHGKQRTAALEIIAPALVKQKGDISAMLRLEMEKLISAASSAQAAKFRDKCAFKAHWG